jgi:hypothetical protein
MKTWVVQLIKSSSVLIRIDALSAEAASLKVTETYIEDEGWEDIDTEFVTDSHEIGWVEPYEFSKHASIVTNYGEAT